ncbi:hypothetical protein [Staphylococcus epidermidis]
MLSEGVLVGLINKGMVGEEGYDKVERKGMECWERKRAFREVIEED